MAEIGLQAYRFSICWPRVLPTGRGVVNLKGLDFYDRLVDALLARNIQPWPTLFHWDYPYALHECGGWLNSDSPRWFADYAAIVATRLGDRVQNWFTLNEPQMFPSLGYQQGIHAPGLRLPDSEVVRICHHTLLAHGRGVQALRSHATRPIRVGWACAIGPILADAADPESIELARQTQFEVNPKTNWVNTCSWWNDPAVLGRYPADGLLGLGQWLPEGWENDMAVITAPLDFLGMNTYAGTERIVRTTEGKLQRQHESKFGDGYPRTNFGWAVTPDALYWGTRFLHDRYRLPIVIAENGMSSHDWVTADGTVPDSYRIDFLRGYLRGLGRAEAEGVPIEAYFHWALLDNFEWAEGYKQRFGLIHVDFATQKRTLKDSAHWYGNVILTNCENL